ncbi:MAG: CvpA family protein [Eubacteriales bacterium]|nr:CvpA family protein [Eubacteriales bacterium]
MTTVDWIIVIIIALYALLGLRRGFVATVVYTIGSIVSLFGALAVASHFKQPVGAMLAPHMEQSVSEAIPQLSQAANTASDIWEDVSGYLQGILASYGISPEVLDSSDDPRQMLASAISLSIGEAVGYIIVFIIAFLLFKLLLHVIVGMLGIVTHLPVLHSFNAILGGALGAVTGLALCTIVLWALKLFVPAAYSDAGPLSPSVMQESSVARYLVGWNNDAVPLFETTNA